MIFDVGIVTLGTERCVDLGDDTVIVQCGWCNAAVCDNWHQWLLVKEK